MSKYYLDVLYVDVLFDKTNLEKNNLDIWVNICLGVKGEEYTRDFTLNVISYDVLFRYLDFENVYLQNAFIIEEFDEGEIEKHVQSIIDKCSLDKSEDEIFMCLKENLELNEYQLEF